MARAMAEKSTADAGAVRKDIKPHPVAETDSTGSVRGWDSRYQGDMPSRPASSHISSRRTSVHGANKAPPERPKTAQVVQEELPARGVFQVKTTNNRWQRKLDEAILTLV
jgi:hypothetical protein